MRHFILFTALFIGLYYPMAAQEVGIPAPQEKNSDSFRIGFSLGMSSMHLKKIPTELLSFDITSSEVKNKSSQYGVMGSVSFRIPCSQRLSFLSVVDLTSVKSVGSRRNTEEKTYVDGWGLFGLPILRDTVITTRESAELKALVMNVPLFLRWEVFKEGILRFDMGANLEIPINCKGTYSSQVSNGKNSEGNLELDSNLSPYLGIGFEGGNHNLSLGWYWMQAKPKGISFKYRITQLTLTRYFRIGKRK